MSNYEKFGSSPVKDCYFKLMTQQEIEEQKKQLEGNDDYVSDARRTGNKSAGCRRKD